MTAKTGDEREIEVELVLEPVDGVCGAACEDFDEVVACEVFRGFLRVFEEDLGVVLNALCELGAGASAIDTARKQTSELGF